MTRPGGSSLKNGASLLVLDGSEVKLRLTAERQRTGSVVHVDWVRFTTARRNASAPNVDVLFPKGGSHDAFALENFKEVSRVLSTLPDCEHGAAAQARELAQLVAHALGPDFSVASDVRKGHDFYRFRWAIERNETECGWVGFLASGDSPRQAAQARTLHVNVFGSACTFASEGWNLRLADLVDECQGDVTRCDLALDFFEGLDGGLERVLADYKAGSMDVGGRRLKSNCVGDWANGHERSFYTGSKEAGKQTNYYEKGDQLFGVQARSPWIRAELRYGNKLRVLSSDLLRRPADFFAGASDYHAMLVQLLTDQVAAEKVRTNGRLAIETVQAEVTRNARWTLQTAAASLAAMFQFADNETFLQVVSGTKLPGRLRKFAPSELRSAFGSLMVNFSTAESAGPAFAQLQPRAV
jgi:phage replication initiation protein